MIKSFLYPEGRQNSKVTTILLKGWIWPIGEASAGEDRSAPAACAADLFQNGCNLTVCQNFFLMQLCFFSIVLK